MVSICSVSAWHRLDEELRMTAAPTADAAQPLPAVVSERAAAGGVRASVDEQRLALRAATMYHLDGATQAQIATRLGVSRPTAGRLVARARAWGLVRIEVTVPLELRGSVHADLEQQLERIFGLDEAMVVSRNVDDGDPGYLGVGRGAASVLARRLQPGYTVGFTWGPETVAVARALPARARRCARVVQLDGGMTTADFQTGADYVLSQCADRLQASPLRLLAPLYADPATVTALERDSGVSRALRAGREAEVMFFGLGPVGAATTLFEGSFLDEEVLAEVSALGAAGEIGGRFFDADGADVGGSMPARTVSVGLDAVRACPVSILVSGGRRKHTSIRAALRGGLATVLVTDMHSAQVLVNG